MSGRPWYKRYGADFVHGTLGLTLEQKGAYSLCLDLIYDRGGPIPDDARWLAGVCGVSVRRWNSIRAALLEAEKITAENGFISNFRAEKEIKNALKIGRKHAENGAKGGNKRAKNERNPRKNNDLGQAGLKHRAHKPEARSQSISPDGDIYTEAVSDFDEFFSACPRRVGRGHAEKAYAKALRETDHGTIMTGIRRYAVECMDRDPKYIKHPSTWLNSEGWADEPTPQPRASPPHGESQLDQFRRIASEINPHDTDPTDIHDRTVVRMPRISQG